MAWLGRSLKVAQAWTADWVALGGGETLMRCSVDEEVGAG